MPDIRVRQVNGFRFESPYFSEYLTTKENGYLPRDAEAHALFHYWLIANRAIEDAKKNFVYEGEPDKVFNGRAVFEGIANAHGVSPGKMCNYWDVVERQRRALGMSANADLPEIFKFKYWGN